MKPPELHEPDGRPHLVEPIVVAARNHVVAVGMSLVAGPRQSRHAVRTEKTHTLRQLLVVGDDHAAFSDREILVGEEAKAAEVPERSAHLVSPAGTWCMCGVLDYDEPSIGRGLENGV